MNARLLPDSTGLSPAPEESLCAPHCRKGGEYSADASRVLDWDDLGLAELHALLSRAALFVGGDSGPLHVAATTPVPIVGIYGPTLAERSSPWRDPHLVTVAVTGDPLPCRPCEQRQCVPGDFRCLTALPATRRACGASRSACRRSARSG